MDQIMAGYGVNASQPNQPPPSYNSDIVLTSDNSSTHVLNKPKKELTLAEKQELANKLDNSLSFNDKPSMSSSASLSNLKSSASKTATESLMDKNLADLNFTSSYQKPMATNSTSASNFNLLSQPNNMNSQQMNFQSPQNRFQSPNNSLNNFQNGMNNQFNAFNRPANPQQSISNFQNQQMGFFGNLALPAPVNNANKTSIPTIAPPPSMNLMKPTQTLSQNGNNNAQGKKTALDDLADIFG